MMGENSWPFYDGSEGTPVLEDEWSIMARQWAPSGVVEGFTDELEVYANSSGREVHVKEGRANVRGHWYVLDAEDILAVEANSSGSTRIDRVVLRLDPAADEITLVVKQGTPAGSPVPPTLTQTDVGTYEISLAKVTVVNGAVSLSAGTVADEREYCGDPVSTAGATMSGAIAMGGNKITGLAAGTTSGDAVRYDQALLLAGGNMTGSLGIGAGANPRSTIFADGSTSFIVTPSDASGNLRTDDQFYYSNVDDRWVFEAPMHMASQKITGLAAGSANGDAVRYEQALLLAGGTMSGAIAMGSNKVTGLAKGTATGDAVARQQIQGGTTSSVSAGSYATVTFSPAFGSTPAVVAVPMDDLGSSGRFYVDNISTTGCRIHNENLGFVTGTFQWIAVGN